MTQLDVQNVDYGSSTPPVQVCTITNFTANLAKLHSINFNEIDSLK